MSIEIAIINGTLVDNYTHKFLKTMIYLKYYKIVGVVEKKPRAAWKGHKDYKYGKIVA